MTTPRYTPLAASLPSTVPFVGPETQERARGQVFKARLGANESVFGPSPKAIKAMQDAVPDTWKYGDAENFDLKAAIAKRLSISPANVVIGSGIDGLLGSTVRLLVGQGDRVVTSAGAYPTFNYHVNGFGGVLVTVPFRDDFEDTAALVAKAAEVDAKLVYLANPDNPMGTCHSGDAVQAMIDALPAGCLLVLDEAYLEFAPANTAPVIDVNDPRVLRFRTFSKAYGMAGARVGYALGHSDVIQAFNKVRNHFGMSKVSQIGALAAFADQAYLRQVIDNVDAARRRIAAIGRANGLTPINSATNFVALDCGRDGDYARRILGGLIDRDVFVRMPFVAPEDRCIRVSAGTKPELDLFEAALPQALEAAK